mgnify:CR=1 FL=1|tara:strand:+ start:94 stop:276 length:183 start_codon:yes stop_codon:yes gene_type:complete
MKTTPQFDYNNGTTYYLAETTCQTTGRKVLCEGVTRHDASSGAMLTVNNNRLQALAQVTT